MTKIVSENLENSYQIYKAVAENRMTVDEGYAKFLRRIQSTISILSR